MANPNKDIAIAIIGAGPSGLAAAECLKDAGFTNITVFEKSKRAGGMALSHTYQTKDGRKIIYELGSLQPVASGVGYFHHLLKKYDMHMGKEGHQYKTVHGKLYSIKNKSYILDFTHSVIGYPMKKILPFLADVARLLTQLLRYRNLGKSGYTQVKGKALADLSIPYEDWIDQQNFRLIGDSIKYNAGSMLCYGDIEEKKSITALKYIKNFWVFMKFPPRYVNGKFRLMREGYQTLWERVAKNHHVLYGVHINSIKRNDKIAIELDQGTMHFDKLIITTAPDQTMKYLDVTDDEVEVFQKVRFCPGWRVSFLAKGLPKDAVYGIYEPMFYPAYYPNILCFYPEGQVDEQYTLYGSVLSGKKDEIDQSIANTEKVLKEHFNAQEIQWLDKIYWPEYGAHFDCEDTRNGVYQQYENLQGRKNTYYAGASISGGTHPVVVQYAHDLIQRFFK